MNTNQLIEESKNLAIKLKNGDKEAFTSLYELLKNYVYNIITYNGVTGENAEDVMQDVFVEIYRKIDTLDNPQAMLKWTKIIARNRSIDYLRKNKVEFTTDEEDNDYIFEESAMVAPIEMPEDVMDNAETTRLVKDIIEELPEMQKKCIYFYYFNEMKTREIANTLGCPEGTVKTNLVKGRKGIEKAVLELAKKHGTKLFAIPVFGVMFFAFSNKAMAAEMPEALSARVLSSTLSKCGMTAAKATQAGAVANASAAAKAGTVASKGIMATLGAKGIAIIAAVAAAAVVTVSIVAANVNSEAVPEETVASAEEIKTTTEETVVTEEFVVDDEIMAGYRDFAVEFCNEDNMEQFRECSEYGLFDNSLYGDSINPISPQLYEGAEYEYLGYAFITDNGRTGKLIMICKGFYPNDVMIHVGAGTLIVTAKTGYLPVVFENVDLKQSVADWENKGNHVTKLTDEKGFSLRLSYLGNFDSELMSDENVSENLANYDKYVSGVYLSKYELYQDIISDFSGNVELSDEIKTFSDYDDSTVAHCDWCGNETESYFLSEYSEGDKVKPIGKICICEECCNSNNARIKVMKDGRELIFLGQGVAGIQFKVSNTEFYNLSLPTE